MKTLNNYINEVLVKTNIKSNNDFPYGEKIKFDETILDRIKENDYI